MATVRYIGPHTAVELRVDGVTVEVQRGDTLTIKDEDAPGLLAQTTNWEAVPEKPAKPAK